MRCAQAGFFASMVRLKTRSVKCKLDTRIVADFHVRRWVCASPALRGRTQFAPTGCASLLGCADFQQEFLLITIRIKKAHRRKRSAFYYSIAFNKNYACFCAIAASSSACNLASFSSRNTRILSSYSASLNLYLNIGNACSTKPIEPRTVSIKKIAFRTGI